MVGGEFVDETESKDTDNIVDGVPTVETSPSMAEDIADEGFGKMFLETRRLCSLCVFAFFFSLNLNSPYWHATVIYFELL